MSTNFFYVNTPITQGFYNTGFLQPYNIACDYKGLYARYLLQKVMNIFEFDFPDEWVFGLDDYFCYNLFISGNIPVFYDRQYGFICQWGAYSGVSISLRPEWVTIQNQFINSARRKIGVDCVIFSLTRDYCGVWDKVVSYAELLSEMHVAIKVNIINSKNPTVYGVPDKKIAENMKKMFDTIQEGTPAVFQKQSSAVWEQFNPNARQNYLTTDMLEDMRRIVNMFCTDFGLPNTNTGKKERMSVSEVNMNNAETDSWADSAFSRLKKCCDEVQRIFGRRYIDVDWSEAIKRQRGDSNETPNINTMGNGGVSSGNPG